MRQIEFGRCYSIRKTGIEKSQRTKSESSVPNTYITQQRKERGVGSQRNLEEIRRKKLAGKG